MKIYLYTLKTSNGNMVWRLRISNPVRPGLNFVSAQFFKKKRRRKNAFRDFDRQA